MIPIDQVANDCLSACIASILEKNLQEVSVCLFDEKLVESATDAEFEAANVEFLKKLDKQLKILGHDIIQVGYHAYKQSILAAIDYNNYNQHRKNQFNKNIKNRPLISIPTECYCILYMFSNIKNDIINMESGREGHALVGYIDVDGNILIIHDPNKFFRDANYKWDLKDCQRIGFLIKR